MARPSVQLQSAMTSHVKENEGAGGGGRGRGGYFQKSKRTDNHRQESGNAEPINKRRFFFSFFPPFFFFAFRAENLYV